MSLFSAEFLSEESDQLPFSQRFQHAPAVQKPLVRTAEVMEKPLRAVEKFLKRQRLEETLLAQDSYVLRRTRKKLRKTTRLMPWT
jgi:hypothetical protein